VTKKRSRLDEQLCFALYAASRAFTRAYAPLLGPLGVTYPQYLVLLVLWDGDDVSVSELGSQLGLDSGTLTPLLKRMEESGLVTRARNREDERVVLVSLTKAGRALEARAKKIPFELACRAGFEPTKESLAVLGHLRDTLTDLAHKLDKATENAAESAALPRRYGEKR
jgi:DNA-binding MarR family transcriptional regulator